MAAFVSEVDVANALEGILAPRRLSARQANQVFMYYYVFYYKLTLLKYCICDSYISCL